MVGIAYWLDDGAFLVVERANKNGTGLVAVLERDDGDAPMMFFQRMATRLESAVSWSQECQWGMIILRNAGGTTNVTHCVSFRRGMICSFHDMDWDSAWDMLATSRHDPEKSGYCGGYAILPPVFRRMP